MVTCKPKCPLYEYCLTQRAECDTCDDMMRRYNANLLLPPELIKNTLLPKCEVANVCN